MLIHDQGPRQNWKFGVIQNLIATPGDEPRAAFVRTTGGNVTRRGLDRLFLLETHVEREEEPDQQPVEEIAEEDDEQPIEIGNDVVTTRRGRQIPRPAR